MKYSRFKSKRKISYGMQHIFNSDLSYVLKSLKQEKITQGINVDKFESNLSNFFGSKYSLAVSSGTAALHISMLTLNLSKGDKVLTSPISFLASANCAEYVGAEIDFCDINNLTYTIDPEKIESKLKKDKKIKAIVVVDYAGHPADWKDLKFLKEKYGVRLINDNCHALGSKLENKKNYAVKFADIVTQSFHPVKHITTGEGGAIITNNKEIYEKAKILRNHGIERKKKDQKNKGMWFYKMSYLGFNYRLSDINCSLGISQLKSLNKFIQKRRFIAKKYNSLLKDVKNIILPFEKKGFYHSYHLYPLRIDFKRLKIDKKVFFEKMFKLGISLQVHYIPIYKHPYYKNKYRINVKNFPVSENFYNQVISLPIYYSLSQEKINYVCKSLKSILCK